MYIYAIKGIINPLNAKLNPICHLLALLGVHHFLNVSRIRVNITFFLLWPCDPTPVMASLFLRFLDHTQRLTALGRTPLDEWSARRRDLYL